MSDAKFADGIYFNKKRPEAPEFVLGSLSFLPEKFGAWLKEQTPNAKGYVRLNIKESREGKIYMDVDTWEPKTAPVAPAILPSTKEKEQYDAVTSSAPATKPEDLPF